MSELPLVDARNLNVTIGAGANTTSLVRNVSFQLGREKLAIIGESGAGKSTVGRAIMRLLPPALKVSADRLQFKEDNLLTASEARMMQLRGRHIGLIMQDPKYSLNPLIPVGQQIAESWWLHHKGRRVRKEADERAMAMLEAVQIRDPARVAKLYPHEVSGGMGQRVMIAMMLILGPDLLIADEPTSALDVTVRTEVLALLEELVTDRGLGLMFISHDLNLVRHFCDRLIIMYAGRIVESLKAEDLEYAEHPYTRALLSSLPSIRNQVPRLQVMVRDPAWLNPSEDAA